MTDLALNGDGDLLVHNGQLVLISSEEELVRQRLSISLGTFTKTWFENQNFGINQELVFTKGTEDLLTQDIKNIITTTKGVNKLLSYTYSISKERQYTSNFTYETDEGLIVSIANLGLGGLATTQSAFKDGVWDYGIE